MNALAPLRFRLEKIKKKVATRHGWLGDYDYAYLFTPKVPFWRGQRTIKQPFFPLNSEMPIILAFLLGIQHCLAMVAGIITPPIIIASVANFDVQSTQYLVGASLIVSGFLSMIQITRFKIYGTRYYLGSGMLSVVGSSFGVIAVVLKVLPQMYATGYCPVDANGKPLPCPKGYGAIIGTSCLISLWEMILAIAIPPKKLKEIFNNIVCGSVVLVMGISILSAGLQDWLGGAGCVGKMCEAGRMGGEWGNARFIGLGFLVYVTIIISEKWGSPIMKSCGVIIGLLVGCIVAAATGYFDRSGIDAARVVSFVWVETFPLSIYGPAVLPFFIVYTVLLMETIGDLTATAEVSRLETEGELYESRIQGGVLGDAFNSMLAGLCTITPMSTFAQNNGVIAITRCANRTVGYFSCVLLIIMGIFTKFAAALVAIPKPVLGGMTSFLFTSVMVSGLKIIASTEFTRRDRFILTASLLPGLCAVLIPNWFSGVFTYHGKNTALKGFLDSITLIMESSYALAGIIATALNQFLPEVIEEWDNDDHVSDIEDNGSIEEIAMDDMVAQYSESTVQRKKVDGNDTTGSSSTLA